jgi:hypothetical protein
METPGRRQDLNNPVTSRREGSAGGPDLGYEEEVAVGERQLAAAIRRCRGDDAALLSLLGGVPSPERLMARLVLVRELGVERADDLSERAFGAGQASRIPVVSLPMNPIPPGAKARHEFARARGLVETMVGVLRTRPEEDRATIGGLLASFDAAVVRAALVLLRRDVAGDATELHRRIGDIAAGADRPPTGVASSSALAPVVERRAATLYRRASSSGAAPADPDHPAVEEALRRHGEGDPLPETLRREMEAYLDVDLGRVRVHCDDVADAAAQAIHARAFTVGEDVYFSRGGYSPETEEGRRLLLHELTHVAQAHRAGAAAAPPLHGLQVSDPSDAHEREAEAVASASTSGEGMAQSAASDHSIARADRIHRQLVPVQPTPPPQAGPQDAPQGAGPSTAPASTEAAPTTGDAATGSGAASTYADLAAKLRQIIPHLPPPRAQHLAQLIGAAMQEFSINDPAQQAMFIAQMMVETGNFHAYTEVGSDAHCDTAYYHRLGNTEEHDGSRYRGRGGLQITGRDLYRTYGARLHLDLEAHPELAAQEDQAFRVAACYWISKRIADRAFFEQHQPAWNWSWIPPEWERQKLNDVALAGTGIAYDYISLGINPGLHHHLDRFQRRHDPFIRAAAAFGLSGDTSRAPVTQPPGASGAAAPTPQ